MVATTVLLALGGSHPIDIEGIAIQGYHRPLGGEVASLVMIVAYEQVFPDWIQAPPLGLTCRVEYDGVLVMTGYLYVVRATSTAIELRIEG